MGSVASLMVGLVVWAEGNVWELPILVQEPIGVDR